MERRLAGLEKYQPAGYDPSRRGKVGKGDIILFHNDSQYLLDALPTLLQSYKEQGLQMVKVSDILLEGETTIDVQGKQHPLAAKE